MVITVFGATGQVGKQVVKQALAEGHHVRAFGRNVAMFIDDALHTEHFEAIQGHVFDEVETFEAIDGCDAVISTLGGAFDGLDKTRSLGVKNIIAQMEKAGVKRIAVLGGKGVLDAPNGGFIVDAADYPAMYRPVGKEHEAAYIYLKESSVTYTFICSPNILNEEVTGKYVTGTEALPEPDNNEIASGDLAHCMLQAINSDTFLNARVGISSL